MSKTLTLAEAKEKFHKITRISLWKRGPQGLLQSTSKTRNSSGSAVLLTEEEFLLVVKKLRNPRPKVHVVGAEAKTQTKRKSTSRDSNLLSETNPDLELCQLLLVESGPTPRRVVESHFAWSERKAGRVLASLVHYGRAVCEGTGAGQYYIAAARKARSRR